MAEENISQEFRLKNIEETRNYFCWRNNWWVNDKQKELMSKKHKNVCATINYFRI